MSLPEFSIKLIETKLERYCQTKIPDYPRNFGMLQAVTRKNKAKALNINELAPIWYSPMQL